MIDENRLISMLNHIVTEMEKEKPESSDTRLITKGMLTAYKHVIEIVGRS